MRKEDWDILIVFLIVIIPIALWILLSKTTSLDRLNKLSLKRLFQFANNPTKRIGLIFIIISICIYLIMVLHWNIFKKPFFYIHTWEREIEKPIVDTKSTLSWFIDSGWNIYNRECVETYWKNNSNKYSIWILQPPTETNCLPVKFIPREYETIIEWEQSFDDYYEALFNEERGHYFTFNIIGLFTFLLGCFMYFGIFDRLWNWIKSGNI